MISVVMATYNGERFLVQQLESILEDLPNDAELVIVDDFSRDGTRRILQEVSDERVKTFFNDRNLGVTKSFSKGLEACRGEYIFLADQDDFWVKGKVERCVELLQSYDLICHDCAVVDENMQTISSSYIDFRRSAVGIWRNVLRNGYIGCCMAFRRSVYLKARSGVAVAPMHDVWLGLVAEIFRFRVAFVKESLVLYRRHGNVVTKTGLRKFVVPSLGAILSRVKLVAKLLAIRLEG
ncbi:MAG: alpha-L-Rha alpha-1,3-L-rhamnosyltransferase [Spongiibacter sp.]|uniref:glycosyltransferase family 2 protein n=1 Tax=Spongiibacter sp. TaxID=2024860 RepID=UPI000C0A85B2|nr:glycosyltransferase family 2 protein [Spongiibacter sp.]MAK42575.1 alpha-L-Rha alpha-1,3-L-rhamnosyltransferase [Spongiibacter sp.]|tara:strand:+ start:4690 stop:5400 length:711 start_codon:yes stop_codon:yes gene_type:complete